MRGELRRLRAIPGADWVVFALAFIFCPITAGLLRLRDLQSVQSLVRSMPVPSAADRVDPRRVGRLVNRAAALWGSACLPRSVVTWWLLEGRSADTELRLGARPQRGAPDFHAWVEHGGVVVNDRSDIADQFAAFDRLAPTARLD